MAEDLTCPRCGATGRPDDDVCRRCGTDLARAEPSPSPVTPIASPKWPARFSLPWFLGAVVTYAFLLFVAFQIFADSFREWLPALLKLRTEADLRAHADTVSAFVWRVVALVGVSYAVAGIALGRFAGGRPVLQATIAAPISWALLSLRAAAISPGLTPMVLPLVVGGAIVTLAAWLGAAFGAWLRPHAQ